MSNSCDPIGCSPPGSSVHGILQARILEWVAISSSRGASWPRDWTQVSCTAGSLPHCRWILYWLSHQEAKKTCELFLCPFEMPFKSLLHVLHPKNIFLYDLRAISLKCNPQSRCTVATQRDGMGREEEGGFGTGGGGHIYTHGWSMSMYGKNHHNIVK